MDALELEARCEDLCKWLSPAEGRPLSEALRVLRVIAVVMHAVAHVDHGAGTIVVGALEAARKLAAGGGTSAEDLAARASVLLDEGGYDEGDDEA